MFADALFELLMYDSLEPVGLQNPESQVSISAEPEIENAVQG
jgi:hypothetical protein